MVDGIFDSHAHYDDDAFDADRDGLLRSLASHGVRRVMNVGSSMESSRTGIQLGKEYDFLYSSVGVHPDSAREICDETLRELAELAREPKVRALGEIGLDYHYEDNCPREIQIPAFERQLALAKELDIPVIIHTREAVNDTLALLKKYQPRGIVHCFSGSVEMAKEVLKLGMYIGFTGVLTFKNARKAVEVVQYAPADRLLIETDCPYMAPEPLRGRRCDSTMLQYTLARMARGSLRRRWLPSPGKMPAQSTDCRNNTKRKNSPENSRLFFIAENPAAGLLFFRPLPPILIQAGDCPPPDTGHCSAHRCRCKGSPAGHPARQSHGC